MKEGRVGDGERIRNLVLIEIFFLGVFLSQEGRLKTNYRDPGHGEGDPTCQRILRGVTEDFCLKVVRSMWTSGDFLIESEFNLRG